MSHTPTEVATEANALYSALASDLNINLDLPALTLPTDFEVPSEVGNPAYANIDPLTLEQLTTKVVGGSGVFDGLMAAVNAHLTEQHKANRITGADYAKVYMGSINAVMQFGVQFLLGKDRAHWENLNLQAQLQLAQAQKVRAMADVQVARAQIQQMQFATADAQLKAYTSRNQYALSKMELVNGYNGVLQTEAQIKLISEQYEVQRAQTRDTHEDGTAIVGLLGKEKALRDAQVLTAEEELDSARAQTKDTLRNGQPISGLVAIDRDFKEAQKIHMVKQGELISEQVEAAHAQISDTKKDGITPIAGLLAVEKLLKSAQEKQVREQYEATRAQTRNTLSDGSVVSGILGVEKEIKLAQKTLTIEQTETQRAQTWETHLDGTPIQGIAKYEKDLKSAQSKLVLEQYESQRGQTRGTLSTGEVVVGLIGTQTRLYEQQITSYKRDAESKFSKMLLDTWTARKTIDEGVAVPGQIDTTAIDTALSAYKNNLDL